MLSKLPWFGFLFVFAILTSCGKETSTTGTQVGPGPTPPAGAQVQLLLFSAPWCENCKRDVPAIDAALRLESSETQAKVAGRLVVTSAETATKPPTDEIAQRYRELLGVQFQAEVDPWRWQTFRKYFGEKAKLMLPAAVLLKADGTVIRTFASGSFVPGEVLAVTKENLN